MAGGRNVLEISHVDPRGWCHQWQAREISGDEDVDEGEDVDAS